MSAKRYAHHGFGSNVLALPARNTGSATSRKAGASIATGTIKRDTLEFIAECGERGATPDEAQRYFIQRGHQSNSPRFTELEDEGWIFKKGEQRKTHKNKDAEVYVDFYTAFALGLHDWAWTPPRSKAAVALEVAVRAARRVLPNFDAYRRARLDCEQPPDSREVRQHARLLQLTAEISRKLEPVKR